MKRYNDISDELLGKYITKSPFSEEENEEILKWEGSEDTETFLRDIDTINKDIERLKSMSRFNSMAALNKVNSRIRKINRYRTIYNAWQKVAAIIVIPLIVYSLLQITNSIEKENNIIWHETSSTYGMISKITLPDGSIAELNSCSQLRYPSEFDAKERIVELKGEGFFKVSSNKEHPFIVKCDDISVQAVGTEFNIQINKNGKIITSLKEGTVNIIKDTEDNEQKMVTLTPGQTAIYDKNISDITEIKTNNIDKYLAWREGKLIFTSDKLIDVLDILEQRFNVKFRINPSADISGVFTGTFVNKDLDTILKYIGFTTSVEFKSIPEKMDEARIIEVR